MLGALTRKIVGLPPEVIRTLYDLVEKLGGKSGKQWLAALKHFLRREHVSEHCLDGVFPPSNGKIHILFIPVDVNRSWGDAVKNGAPTTPWVLGDHDSVWGVFEKYPPHATETSGVKAMVLVDFSKEEVREDDILHWLSKQWWNFRDASPRTLLTLSERYDDLPDYLGRESLEVVSLAPCYIAPDGVERPLLSVAWKERQRAAEGWSKWQRTAEIADWAGGNSTVWPKNTLFAFEVIRAQLS
jgi:hypothetical protein